MWFKAIRKSIRILISNPSTARITKSSNHFPPKILILEWFHFWQILILSLYSFRSRKYEMTMLQQILRHKWVYVCKLQCLTIVFSKTYLNYSWACPATVGTLKFWSLVIYSLSIAIFIFCANILTLTTWKKAKSTICFLKSPFPWHEY